MTTRTSRLSILITTTRQPDGRVTHRADYADEPLEPGVWRAVEALADVEAGKAEERAREAEPEPRWFRRAMLRI